MHEEEWNGTNPSDFTKEEFDLYELNLSVAAQIKEDSEAEKLIPMIYEALRVAGNRNFKIRPSIRANAFSNASTYYHLLGHDKHAIPYLQKALDTFHAVKLDDNDKMGYAITLSNAARLKVGLSLFDEAEHLYIEAIKMKEEVLPKDHHSLYRTVLNLARLYEHVGQPEKANSLRKKYQSAFADNPWRQVSSKATLITLIKRKLRLGFISAMWNKLKRFLRSLFN